MSKKKDSKEKLIRICVFGAAFCGKSTLCNRFVNNAFEWVYEPTTEVGVFRKLVNITGDEDHIQYWMMQIEDVFPVNHPYLQMSKGDNPEVNQMTDYYERALDNTKSDKKQSNEKNLFKETFIQGYMYVYDMTSLASLEEVEKVIEYIHTREEKEAGKKKSGQVAKILVGTKKDICGYTPIIPDNKIDQIKKKFAIKLHKKVSSLTNSLVAEAFLDLARDAIDRASGANGQVNSDDSEDESNGFFGFLSCGKREKNDSKCKIF